jgi:hypothetical protein
MIFAVYRALVFLVELIQGFQRIIDLDCDDYNVKYGHVKAEDLKYGDKKQSILARLSRINPLTNQIEISFSFNNGDAPRNLCLNKTKDTLYFLNNDVYRMAISEINLPSSSFINKGNKNFYGLGVNPNDYNIYAADALDYSQKSNIYIFDSYGNEKSVFKAGINANGFYFE